MSDISGPPLPKPVDPVARTTGKPSGVSKDPNQAQAEAREHKGESSSKNDQAEQVRGREPAVSISATAAHLEVGERLKEKVTKIDNEGRPIIVTETATFALRPDAGLRPGDDVKLEIIEAGHKLAADLHEKNGYIIDPPVRLTLIVIALHTKAQPVETVPPAQNQPLLPEKTGYGPAIQTRSFPNAPAEALVNVLGRTTQPVPLAPPDAGYSPQNHTTTYTDGNPDQSGQAMSQQFGNPDFLVGRSSSPDLATLIAAQQGSSQKRAGYVTSSGVEAGIPKNTDPTHIIPKSSLTNLVTNNPQIGLGAAVRAFSYTGVPYSLQVMDPGISQVSPSQVATVLSVRPLPPDEAKALPLPITAFGSSTGTLATVETNKGNFVVPLTQASHMSGEQVKVTSLQAAPSPTPGENQITFNAILTPPGTKQRRPVTVLFTQNAQSDGSVPGAQIKAVHTVRAFLTPKGPSADFRIETTSGELFVTMPNSFRPTTEDLIQIQPSQSSLGVAIGGPTSTSDTVAQLASGSALGTIGAHHWPVLEQGFAAMVDAEPAIAGQLSSKSAQGGGKLANSLLFFLSAAGRGGPEAWLGHEASKALEQSHKSLFDALKSELTRLMQAASDPTTEWRPALVPLELRLPEMPLVAMLFGPPPKDDGAGRKFGGAAGDDEGTEDGRRFLVEVQFSILGAVQLDGLVKERRFDLVMRTEKPLPAILKHEAAALFGASLGTNGYVGQLTISEVVPFPINVEAIIKSSIQDTSN